MNESHVVDLRLRGEAFMIAPYDVEKPKIVKEVLFGLKAKEWIKTM